MLTRPDPEELSVQLTHETRQFVALYRLFAVGVVVGGACVLALIFGMTLSAIFAPKTEMRSGAELEEIRKVCASWPNRLYVPRECQ